MDKKKKTKKSIPKLNLASSIVQLLLLCEAETISYLDEVAGSPKSMQLGQSVALEVGSLLLLFFF